MHAETLKIVLPCHLAAHDMIIFSFKSSTSSRQEICAEVYHMLSLVKDENTERSHGGVT